MDGLSNLVGRREAWLTVGGQTYELSTLTLADLALRERWLLSRRPRLSEIEIPVGLPRAVREQLLEDARREGTFGCFIEPSEMDRFAESPRGRVVSLWISMRARSPDVTLHDAATIVSTVVEEGREAELIDLLEDVTEARILTTLRSGDGDSHGAVPDQDDGRRRRSIPWAYAFERLLQESHLGPEEIGRLSLYRALTLLGQYCPEHIHVRRRSA